MDADGCYLMNATLLADFGTSESSIESSQTYSVNIFPSLNLSTCAQGSPYVEVPDQAVVYLVSGGTKHPFSSWNSLVAQSGSNHPDINFISNSVLSALPTGSAE
jgi:hypothetical protein